MIGVLGWKDFYSTLIQISLLIILYLHFTWLESSASEKSCLHTFSGFRTLSTWHPTTELHPFTLSIPGVAHDQVWYKRPPFYNSNFSTPNGLASLFGEAQLKHFKTPQRWQLALAESHSAPPGSVTQTSSEIPSKIFSHLTMQTLCMLQFQIFQSLLWLLLSISKKPSKQWQYSALTCSSRLKPVVLNLQATKNALKNCKDHVDTTGALGTNHIPFTALFFCKRINFCWHLHSCRNQAIKDLLSWVEFKAFLQKSLGDSKA